MARSVRGLALNLVENIALKRLFHANRGVRSLDKGDLLTTNQQSLLFSTSQNIQVRKYLVLNVFCVWTLLALLWAL